MKVSQLVLLAVKGFVILGALLGVLLFLSLAHASSLPLTIHAFLDTNDSGVQEAWEPDVAGKMFVVSSFSEGGFSTEALETDDAGNADFGQVNFVQFTLQWEIGGEIFSAGLTMPGDSHVEVSLPPEAVIFLPLMAKGAP